MAHARRFRFGVQGRGMGPRDAWLTTLRRVEDAGYSTFLVLDHFVRGLDPIAALGAAATATETLRLGSMVMDNDFRHPAVLAKAMATIDVLSAGRLEIGIGAGWLREEYEQTGIPFDPPGVRIDRMVEAVHLMKRAFVEDSVTFGGEHYTTTNLVMPPKPVQQPWPPIVIGGGSKRILTVAGQEADIVGLTTRALPDGSKDNADMTAASAIRKVSWVREAAGDRFDELELTIMVSDVVVTDDRHAAADRLATGLGVSGDDVLDSPHLLIGTIDEMGETLQRRRELFGISYYVVVEGYMEKLAPVVARLAGQ
ncbi:MAG: TIGR03621 family F420-dependent LLM class oxidoreductase [Chloroflexota bacterium]|nr:TIGR03621 family F420-dependent LLM class oxidoreductase [Chloroflexota bacterium]